MDQQLNVEEKVQSCIGSISVQVKGNRQRPAVLTYHDIVDSTVRRSNFDDFFTFGPMSPVAHNFCIYHVNAPGQEANAERWPNERPYPTIDELALSIQAVVEHFQITCLVGFGVGVGANILVRYGLKYPEKVSALILINYCGFDKATWGDWGYQKMSNYQLGGNQMTPLVVDFLAHHHFGKNWVNSDDDLVVHYREYFRRLAQPYNLALYMSSYNKRKYLTLSRPNNTLKCPVFQIVSADSPYLEQCNKLNKRLNPNSSDFLKLGGGESSAMILLEQADKVTQAVLLFLQGQGYVPSYPVNEENDQIWMPAVDESQPLLA